MHPPDLPQASETRYVQNWSLHLNPQVCSSSNISFLDNKFLVIQTSYVFVSILLVPLQYSHTILFKLNLPQCVPPFTTRIVMLMNKSNFHCVLEMSATDRMKNKLLRGHTISPSPDRSLSLQFHFLLCSLSYCVFQKDQITYTYVL